MISRSHFRLARFLVFALAASVLAPYATADIATGLYASAGSNATVLNNGFTYFQSPYVFNSKSTSDPSVATATASASNGTGTVSSSQNVLVDTQGDVQQITWQAMASGSSWATANYGALHAYASGSEEEIPGTFTYMYYDDSGNPSAVSLTTPLTAQGGASAEAEYTDKFTITSSTLAYLTPVHVRFTFSLDGSTTSPDVFPAAIAADYSFIPNNPWNSPTSMAQLYITQSGSLTTMTVDQTMFVGEVFGISGQLDVHAGTPENCSPPVCDHQTFTSDAANTSNMFIDVQTSGASVDSFSGHNYATPTPEPSTLTFLASGICGLAVLRRRFGG